MTEPTVNPFTSAASTEVAKIYDEYIGQPTGVVKAELDSAEKQFSRGYEALNDGDEPDFQRVVDLGDFGGEAQEAAYKLADLNARLGALRKVHNEHVSWKATAAELDKPQGVEVPGTRAVIPSAQLGPGIAEVLKAEAEAQGVNLFDRKTAEFAMKKEFGVGNNPVLNTLFQTPASNPYQVARPGFLSTLREGPSRLLTALPMREPIGANTEEIFRVKTTDTMGVASRAEGAAAGESTYAWRWFKTRVEDIATSIPYTRESIDDNPGAEQMVEQDLVGELDIDWNKKLFTGTGSNNQFYGLINAGRGTGSTTQANARVQDFGVFPNAINTKTVSYDGTDGFAAEGGGMKLLREIREARGDIEDADILDNRMPNLIVLRKEMLTAIDLQQYAKSSKGSTPSADYQAEWVAGGPFQATAIPMIWGLSVIPQNLGTSVAASGNTVGAIISANQRSIYQLVKQRVELVTGWVNTQMVEWELTVACRIRVGLAFPDPAAHCILNRA